MKKKKWAEIVVLLLFTHPNTYNKWQHKNSTLTAFRFLHFSPSTSTSTSALIHYIYIYYYYYLLLLLTNHLKFFYIYFYISFFLSLSNLFIFIFFNISLINSTSTYLLIFYKSFDYIHHHPITSFYSQKFFFSLLRNSFSLQVWRPEEIYQQFFFTTHPPPTINTSINTSVKDILIRTFLVFTFS